MNDFICRSCGNSGIDMFGNVCACRRKVPGSDSTYAEAAKRMTGDETVEDQAANSGVWLGRNDRQWTPIKDAPMVRCCVHRRYADRCNEPAVWGEISYLDDGGYRLTAFCAVHWDIHTNSVPPVYDIRINGEMYHVPAHALDYHAIVALAWGEAKANGPHLYSVVYSGGPAHNPEGILAPGESVVLQQDMHFEAMVTGNA